MHVRFDIMRVNIVHCAFYHQSFNTIKGLTAVIAQLHTLGINALTNVCTNVAQSYPACVVQTTYHCVVCEAKTYDNIMHYFAIQCLLHSVQPYVCMCMCVYMFYASCLFQQIATSTCVLVDTRQNVALVETVVVYSFES